MVQNGNQNLTTELAEFDMMLNINDNDGEEKDDSNIEQQRPTLGRIDKRLNKAILLEGGRYRCRIAEGEEEDDLTATLLAVAKTTRNHAPRRHRRKNLSTTTTTARRRSRGSRKSQTKESNCSSINRSSTNKRSSEEGYSSRSRRDEIRNRDMTPRSRKDISHSRSSSTTTRKNDDVRLSNRRKKIKSSSTIRTKKSSSRSSSKASTTSKSNRRQYSQEEIIDNERLPKSKEETTVQLLDQVLNDDKNSVVLLQQQHQKLETQQQVSCSTDESECISGPDSFRSIGSKSANTTDGYSYNDTSTINNSLISDEVDKLKQKIHEPQKTGITIANLFQQVDGMIQIDGVMMSRKELAQRSLSVCNVNDNLENKKSLIDFKISGRGLLKH